MDIADVPLDIKEIFVRKRARFTPQDVARMRYLAMTFVETAIDLNREFRP